MPKAARRLKLSLQSALQFWTSGRWTYCSAVNVDRTCEILHCPFRWNRNSTSGQPRYRFKQDMPAELSSRWNTKG